jgi:hypothetical protein
MFTADIKVFFSPLYLDNSVRHIDTAFNECKCSPKLGEANHTVAITSSLMLLAVSSNYSTFR